ncbi:MAG: ubiE/COQ5 methyltransferase family protein 2 [Ramlibacter sp.]|nr:ubiE/COQ5 methyltransferase family protein 2 [Ramlibacter sp.]
MIATSASFTGPDYYDEQLVPVQFDPFARELLAGLPADLGGPVLEIACGTGALTRLLREWLPAAVELVATDLSPAMLQYAQARSAGRTGITWQVANAQQLPFEDGSFGTVACAFGFMFAADRQAALREARRVLAPGGLLAFTVWDRIEDNPHALANAQVLEALFPGDPQMKFRTPYEMSDPGLLKTLLAAAGFTSVDIATRRLAIAGVDPRVLASGQIHGTPRSALLAQRGVALEGVVADVAAALERQGGRPYAGYAQAKVVQAR